MTVPGERRRNQSSGSPLVPLVPHVLVEFFHSEHESEVRYCAEKPQVPPALRWL